MAALISAPSVVLLACSLVFASCEDRPNVTGTVGQDVLLQCQSPRDAAITMLEWSKPELRSDKYVFFFRGKRPIKIYQHPSFHGRVELGDPEMKDGDASVTLKNVKVDDSGTYECIVTSSSQGRRKRDAEFKHVVNLKVTESGNTAAQIQEGGNKEGGNKEGGSLHLHLGLVSLAVAGLVCCGLVVWVKRRSVQMNSEHPAAAEAEQDSLTV